MTRRRALYQAGSVLSGRSQTTNGPEREADATATAATPATHSSDARHCQIDDLPTLRACGKN